jgi:hypothetical protein
MLGIVICSYDPRLFIYHYNLSKTYKFDYKIIYSCNHTDKELIKSVEDIIQTKIFITDNPKSYHDGAFVLFSDVLDTGELDDCDYILRCDGDQYFQDTIINEKTYKHLLDNPVRIAGIARQWLFDDNTLKVNKNIIATPFHTPYHFLETKLAKSIFKTANLEYLKEKAIAKKSHDGNKEVHLEVLMYEGLLDLNFDFDNDVYYIDDVRSLKSAFGNTPTYYNVTFPVSQIVHTEREYRDSMIYESLLTYHRLNR